MASSSLEGQPTSGLVSELKGSVSHLLTWVIRLQKQQWQNYLCLFEARAL